ncbi:MAG TPA: tetratricopeptide repeat protein [Planctomycetaceae bacterium]|nr:tetratricopeptide repeat protein [Planctomycetaceae bacterium]
MDRSRFEELWDEAADAVERHDNLRAVALTDQLVAEAPQNATVRTLRAQALLQADAGMEAFEEACRAVELGPDSEQAQTILGIAAWRAGRMTLAQQSLERAIELSGRRAGLLVDYAWFMASERGPRLGEQAAREAIQAAPDSSTAWAALGLAQFRLHRRREAEETLKRALQLDPNDPYAQSAMLNLLHEKRQDREAVALTHLLEEVPGTEELVEGVRREAKRRELARKLVERGINPEARLEATRRGVMWILIAMLAIPLVCFLVWPTSLSAFLLCVGGTGLVLMVLQWLFR